MRSKSRIFLLLVSFLSLVFMITGCGTSETKQGKSTDQPETKVNLEGKLGPKEWGILQSRVR